MVKDRNWSKINASLAVAAVLFAFPACVAKQSAHENAYYVPDNNLPKHKHRQQKAVKLSPPQIKKTPKKIVRLNMEKPVIAKPVSETPVSAKPVVEKKPLPTVQRPKVSLAKPELAAQKRQPSLQKTKVEPQALISCGEAGTILNSYGYEDVKISNCGGTVYSFEASLDGQAYAITFNAVTGDATSVQSQR